MPKIRAYPFVCPECQWRGTYTTMLERKYIKYGCVHCGTRVVITLGDEQAAPVKQQA